MALPEFITQRAGFVRTASTVALAAIAIRSFIKGKRLRGLVAAGGAVAVGATALGLEPTELEPEADDEPTPKAHVTESTTEDAGLRCSICDEPIAPGESRRPTAGTETAHEACLNAPASQ